MSEENKMSAVARWFWAAVLLVVVVPIMGIVMYEAGEPRMVWFVDHVIPAIVNLFN